MKAVLVWTEADVIRKLRAETGITLARLAKESGVSLTAINRIEKGHTAEATRDTLARLGTVFGLTVDDVFAAIPRKHPGVPLDVPDDKLARWREDRKKRRRQRNVAVG